ncbi:DUF1476 domain-containing protein [Bartonella tamiae]|uniref:DUF1476 domain-containing protein n=1 Tax=Bartonella tamiae Th239 TaxID=1094558 RepID=J0ZKA5_9HYPH|nr:DUF1476 domain-containing protein [Bartonella tamiae]EJF88783.1 hypothetical protein ME5_01334 [Bartonella tamiae Th239]EJF94967.1 hypothetical protein MEG_00548 [Bartonella tamiae Th307]
MVSMKEREAAYEKKYVLDEELRFKADSYRNRQLGLWAAKQLGKTGEVAEDFAKKIVMIGIENGQEDGVVATILNSFHESNHPMNEKELREKMEQFMQEALSHFQSIK